MRKHWADIAATALCLLPPLWLVYFAVSYRCDLTRYSRLWGFKERPTGLTIWELAVTAAAVLLAAMIAPKIWRLWKTGKALTRGEWITLVLMPAVLAVAFWVAPTAMADPKAQFAAFFGHSDDQCLR